MEPSKIALIQALLSGAQLNVVQERPRLNPAEEDLANALLNISIKHGTFDHSGCGIYASYEAGAVNETQNIGVKCKNCVLYDGLGRCKIISFPVEATGKCRFAVIPDGVVKGYGQL
jgi:hypothetical protein